MYRDIGLHSASVGKLELRPGLYCNIVPYDRGRERENANAFREDFRSITRRGDTRERATLGVRALWTHPARRRRGVASQLLDTARHVMTAGYVSGERDNQLAQAAITLLIELGFTPVERNAAYDQLVRGRPLAFQASLTVAPSGFAAEDRLALFSGYDSIVGAIDTRGGNTMPLDDVRGWFAGFAALVRTKIEAFDVRR